MKNIKVLFLLDKKNDWIKKYLIRFKFNSYKKYKFYLDYRVKDRNKYDLVFILNCTKILKKQNLSKNLNLVVHSSKLPKDKGFAPMQNQILRGSNKINFTLFEAIEKVDSGDIFFRSKAKVKGYELNEELREIQALSTLKLIKKFLTKYPNINKSKQKGFASFNKKRRKEDSKLNINKSIKQQFNLLRICDNEKYPAYFKYKNKTFIIKIYKK
jgi:methionyl-tRNA formyltransferase